MESGQKLRAHRDIKVEGRERRNGKENRNYCLTGKLIGTLSPIPTNNQ